MRLCRPSRPQKVGVPDDRGKSGMRKKYLISLAGFACSISAAVMLSAFGHVKLAIATPSQSSPTSAAVVPLPRGISGLELGMAPNQIREPFKITEDESVVAKLLAKYGKPEESKAVAEKDKALQKQFFHISADPARFPDGVTSADASASHNVIYQIGLHYDEASVKKMGWRGVTYPYVAKYGKPSQDTGSGYIWTDDRTNLDIESSGAFINVFFTDRALDLEVKREEREHQP